MGSRAILLRLAAKSLLNRRLTAGLTVLSVAASVALLLGVDRIRAETKASFANTIAGADLIVGARGGPINLLLYSVFRIGDATSNMSWQSYRRIAARPEVEWTIPLSLGDSHRGFRVLGTSGDYFARYRFGRDQGLRFRAGEPFDHAHDAVLGAEVAAALRYRLGEEIVVSHGIGDASFVHHDEAPFRIVGILARTGTPVDRTVHIGLAGIEAIHADAAAGHLSDAPGDAHTDDVQEDARPPDAITACIVGLKSRSMLFGVQRFVNEHRAEPLMAIVPGVVLQQLWELVGVAETALLAVSAFVVAAGLVGLLTMLLAGLAERRREMAVLRSLGAGPRLVFGLLVAEATILTGLGALLAVGVVHGGMAAVRALVLDRFGLYLAAGWPGAFDLAVAVAVTLAGAFAALAPAWRAYRFSLADGLTVRV